jgi:hypothetical protein
MSDIKRRDFITLLGGAAAWPLTARAQRIDRTMRRVGVLMPFAPDDPEARMRVAALEQGLRDLGWVDSRKQTDGSRCGERTTMRCGIRCTMVLMRGATSICG